MTRETRDHEASIAAALANGRAARSTIVASWARSARLYGLEPALRPRDERLTAGELTALRERMEPVLRAAEPTLDRLFQVVAGLGACVMLANEDGVPLDRRGRAAHDRDFAEAGLWTGTRWSEEFAGTNGIGTCLAEGRPIVVHRDQHYLSANVGLTCASAPVHGPEGDLVAVLDVSIAREDLSEGFAGLVSHSVTEAARRIEADLFHARYPAARMMLVPGLDRGLGALLAVDADELVIGATRAARQHLGLSGDLALSPRPAADLLGLASRDTLDAGERAVLARAMARSEGNVSAAARALGISRATLHRKLAALD